MLLKIHMKYMMQTTHGIPHVRAAHAGAELQDFLMTYLFFSVVSNNCTLYTIMMVSIRCIIRSKQFKHCKANHVASIPSSVFNTF